MIFPVIHSPSADIHTATFVRSGGVRGPRPFPCAALISWFHAECVRPQALETWAAFDAVLAQGASLAD